MDVIVSVIVGLLAALLGGAVGAFFVRRGVLGRTATREVAATQAIAEAENRRKEVLLEAKEEAIRVRNVAEAEIRAQRGELQSETQRLHSKEANLDRKLETLEGRERK